MLTTEYRLTAIDLDEPRVAEGLRITCDLLPRIKAQADARGAKLLVLAIPTKELVFAQTFERRDPVYERFVEMETAARDRIRERCRREGIEYADAMPPLAEAVAAGVQVYPTSTESHPAPEGYRVIAETARKELERRGW